MRRDKLSSDIPPSLVIDQARPPVDVREEIIGAEEAASILKVCRTQVWRLATELKVLPYQVYGTQTRPEYKFRRADVMELHRKRESQKLLNGPTKRERARKDRVTRLMAQMLTTGTPNLRVLMEADPDGDWLKI